ncbi:MAG: glycoside hydrolase family 38 C-terminal domain-containing protein, partial [Eubacteriales bacterium]|nr:glycoside hydrolase family 38 C-terminal domain-containing protein [Eubacteriales bacterium]
RYYRYVDKNGFLGAAWEYVLQNQPHDSICGCSITAVHEDNVSRYKQAKEIIGTVKADTLTHLTMGLDTSGRDAAVAVFNPSQNHIRGVREITFEIQSGTHHGNFRFYNSKGENVKTTVTGHGTYIKKVADYNRLIEMPSMDVYTLALEADIPPYGYEVFTVENLLTLRDGGRSWQYIDYKPPQRNPGSMRISADTVDNGPLVISVNPNGTVSVTDKLSGVRYDNLLLFEDCGDAGEGYNYVKPLLDREYISAAASARVSFMCDSPDIVKLCIDLEPVSGLPIENILTIYRGERHINIKTRADNRREGHRLRVLFPTGIKTDKFATSLPFDVAEWDIEKPDNTYDKETDTLVNPNQGLVSVSDGNRGIAVYNNGLYECEVGDKNSASVYLTLFRSFPHEVGQTGGSMGKMLCEMTFDYGIAFFSEGSYPRLMKLSNGFKTGLDCVTAKPHAGFLGRRGVFAEIAGDAVLSSLRRITVDGGEAVEIRIYDLAGGSEGQIALPVPVREACECDFRHIKTADADVANGKIAYKLNNRQIKTFIAKT